MKRRLVLLIAVLLCLARGPAEAAEIAVILGADVGAYQAALKGFKETVNHRIVAEYDMKGDFDRGREILGVIESEVKPDLILAVGVWALQVIARQTTEIPVVFAMVLNPPTVIGVPRGNITGASMNVPAEQGVQLFKALGPQFRRIGVVYNPSETGYLVDMARLAAERHGLELATREIGSPKEAIQAVNALQQEGVDALWILPDEAILEPKVFQYALLVSFRNKLPLLGLSERQAEMGALLALSFGSSEDIGRQAGELTNEVLGKSGPAPVPFTMVRTVKLVVNLKAAKKLGMEIPDSILTVADTVIR